jgi:hypothetical protein
MSDLLPSSDDLAARPDAPILLVCGPSAMRGAKQLLDAYIVGSWTTADYFDDTGAGEPITNGALKPLAGRKVDLWTSPSAHEGRWPHGAVVAELHRLGCTLRLIENEPGERMDPNTAVLIGWTQQQLLEFARARVREIPPTRPPTIRELEDELPVELSRGKPRTKANGQPPDGIEFDAACKPTRFIPWAELGLDCDSRGMPHPNIANVKKVLAAHPEIISRVWYDEFHHRVYSTFFTEEPAEWTDRDDTNLCAWMQSALRIPKISIDVIKRSVEAIAHANPRHELREWLTSLQWDGTPRLETLLADAYGAEQNAYTAAVGRCWMVSLIARAFLPGCQVDTIVVFEGAQGIRKSSSLSVLGGKWYASLPDPFGSKDFLQSIDGVWLAEIPDMSSFRGRDIQHVKAIITTRVDRYRRSYGYRAESYPRQCVFVATANGSDWNQDPTGARRFWPVACTSVNIDYLTRQRQQILAEALELYRSGASWWDVPDELAMAEQELRQEMDSWGETLENWCSFVGKDSLTLNDIFEGPILIPIERRDMRAQKRVGTLLRRLGYGRTRRRVDGKLTYVFLRQCSKDDEVDRGNRGTKSEEKLV